jgi:hypothetical protein
MRREPAKGSDMTNNLKKRVVAIAAATAAFATGYVHADDAGAFAKGLGISQGKGTTKYFHFNAEQHSPVTLRASGDVELVQRDPSGLFGDFALVGKVVCLRVAGSHAIVGLIIKRGTGTAAPHKGEAFYLTVNDNRALAAPDLFDNSGYTGMPVANCAYEQVPVDVVTKGDIKVGVNDDDEDENDD